MTEPTAIGCLRCRHCALLPHTDMARALDPNSTPVFCAKLGRALPLRLLECPAADPRPTYVRLPSGTYDGPRGDRTRNLSEPEKAFLRAHYERAPRALLCLLLARTWHAVRNNGPRLGLTREPEIVITNRIEGRMRSGSVLNQAQRKYLQECRRAGRWPRQSGLPRAERVRDMALRDEIMAEMARLGRAPRNWRAVSNALRFVEQARRTSARQFRGTEQVLGGEPC